ncbi:two-component regulator propeller domain-containing protein [uncultured Tenacibaculum sp.]|uniref:ligand-binding sensor domain-containing protein n=1 Tax=uncultured Tenacibaculum sp. TaxID=174713 RepID=UPI0026046250|nr:two-component regulator propeller domain-containing protein [uncultured Tenacibaculum sp.]
MFHCINTFCQVPVYKHITTEDGLGDNKTYQIIQDSKGFIWIGTDDGLSMYNGKSIKNYTDNGLRSNYIIDIIEDKYNDQFILATWGGGLHTFKNDSIQKFDNSADRTTNINKVYQLNDSIVIGTNIGTPSVVIYDLKDNTMNKMQLVSPSKNKTSLSLYLKKHSANDLPFALNSDFYNNNIYFFSNQKENKLSISKKGINLVDNKLNVRHFNIEELNNKYVHALVFNKNESIISSYNKIYLYENQKLNKVINISLKRGKIIQMFRVAEILYFVFHHDVDNIRKVYTYNFNSKTVSSLSDQLSIKSSISDILIDRDYNLWITTYGQGVFQVLNTKNNFFSEDVLENTDLRDIDIIDSDIIISSHSLIYLLNDQGIQTKKIPFYTEHFQIDDDKINLITPGRTSETYTTYLNSHKVSNKINETFSFEKDSLKVDLYHDRYEIRKHRKLIKSDVIHNDPEHFFKNATLYKNQVLVNCGRLGVYVIDLKTLEKSKWNFSESFNINIFNDLVVNKDTIWFATNQGAYKITPKSTTHFSTKEGLSSNHINDLFIDSHQKLWAGTQKGLNVLHQNNFYSIDENLGQISSSIREITEKDNYLYAIGNKGLFKMNNSTPFKTAHNTQLIVEQDKNTFTLNTINFINSTSVKLAYQIDDENWILTTDNFLDFNDKKEGNYSIRFKYKDSLSNWQYTPDYYFSVNLPWHQQTWFFVTLTSLFLGLLIVLLLKGLKKSIEKNKALKKTILEKEKLQTALKEVRKNVARDFHDELGNKLASIAITSNLLIDDEFSSNKQNKKVKLQQIKKDADYLYSGMKDFIWSLDHKNDDLHQLQIYLTDFGEELFNNSPISFYTSHNFTEEKIILPYYWSKQLVLIFKEAMTNTLKYSKASKVFLKFTVKKDTLKIILYDNGVGFNIDAVKRVNGIQNMKFRAKTLNQKLKIKTDDGVTITFTGNLKNNKAHGNN